MATRFADRLPGALWPVLMILLVSGPLVAQTPATKSTTAVVGPRLTLDRSEHDFGTIKQGERVETEFIIENSGDAELRLLRIKPACSCTLVATPKTRLAPGQKSRLRVAFDSSGKRGDLAYPVMLTSNDPLQRERHLTLKVRVAVELELRPAVVYLSPGVKGRTLTRRVELVNHGLRPLRLIGLESSRPAIHAVADSLNLPPGGRVTLTLTLQLPATGRDGFSGRLTLLTDHPDYPRLFLPVQVGEPGARRIRPTSPGERLNRSGSAPPLK